MSSSATLVRLRDYFTTDPLMACAVTAGLVAIATTPLAFAVLGRLDWFKARRGRVMQRPEFSSIVCAMMLVMGIPAIFIALVVKSQYFDKNRYEFDPNKTWSVLEQGRGYESLKEADEAIKREEKRLGEIRKNLVENVKKLDESMLTLRAAAATSTAVAQALPGCPQGLVKGAQSQWADRPQPAYGPHRAARRARGRPGSRARDGDRRSAGHSRRACASSRRDGRTDEDAGRR